MVSERHRMAANIRWANQDPREHGDVIREARLRHFRNLADPDGPLLLFTPQGISAVRV